MTRFPGRAAATVFFLATLSLVGNTGSVVNSCETWDAAQASPFAAKDPEPHAIVRALRAVLLARPAGLPGDLWQDLAADFRGISTANRARIQRLGEALYFVSHPSLASRRARVQEELSGIQSANLDLPADEWAHLLTEVDGALAGGKP